MQLLVRSWNVFHGRTDPPGRRRLPPGDGGARDRRPTRRPLPPGGARLGAAPARGLERRDDARSARSRGLPSGRRRSPPGSRARTRRSSARLSPGRRTRSSCDRARRRGSRERADQHRRPRGAARLPAVAPGARSSSPTSTPATTSRTPRSRARRSVGPASSPRDTRAPARRSCSPATSTSRDPGLDGYSAPGEGIDHILVRGAVRDTPGDVAACQAPAEWRGALRPRPGRAAVVSEVAS